MAVITFTIEGGTTLSVDEDKKIYTPAGMQRAGDLQVDDYLCVMHGWPGSKILSIE